MPQLSIDLPEEVLSWLDAGTETSELVKTLVLEAYGESSFKARLAEWEKHLDTRSNRLARNEDDLLEPYRTKIAELQSKIDGILSILGKDDTDTWAF